MISTRTVIEDRYEPGNGTSYHLLLVDLPRNGAVTLVWLNAPGGGRAVILSRLSLVTDVYLAEKLDRDNEADLAAILGWLGQQGFDVA